MKIFSQFHQKRINLESFYFKICSLFNHPYRMDQVELKKLKEQLKDFLNMVFIRTNNFPLGALVMFMKKNDGSPRICIMEMQLNNVIILNKYYIQQLMTFLKNLRVLDIFTSCKHPSILSIVTKNLWLFHLDY